MTEKLLTGTLTQPTNLSSCGQRSLWSDWADAQADLSSLGAHSFCWFCHIVAHLFYTECWKRMFRALFTQKGAVASHTIIWCQCRFAVLNNGLLDAASHGHHMHAFKMFWKILHAKKSYQPCMTKCRSKLQVKLAYVGITNNRLMTIFISAISWFCLHNLLIRKCWHILKSISRSVWSSIQIN